MTATISIRNERRLYLAGAALVAAHIVDAAFVDLEPGATVASHLHWALTTLVLLGATAAAYSRLPRGVRLAGNALLAALALSDGAQHVKYAASDISASGIALVAAGIAFAAAAFAAGWGMNRGRPRARAWLTRVTTAVATPVAAVFVVVPLTLSVYLVHKPRAALGHPDLGAPYTEVAFPSSDGLTIRAWYVPPRNGAVVVLLHGSGGDRSGTRHQARMLVRHGYGALLVDARGRGTSDGDNGSYGWTWNRDVRGAVDFLSLRGVERIAAYGLSTGAEVALQAAAEDRRIDAVVSDGAEARSVRENALDRESDRWFVLPYTGMLEVGYRFLSGERRPPSLDTLVPRISPRPLLIVSTGDAYEQTMGRVWFAAAKQPKQLYELPNAAHTRGLAAHPHEYEARVVGFLDRALFGRDA
jgi:pimeloyl-ACP methyl ester carboxylesterase